MGETKHYLLGGSSAAVWSECHGYALLAPTIPHLPPGKAALKGTRIHDNSEGLLKALVEHKRTGSTLAYTHRTQDEEEIKIAKDYVMSVWKDVLKQSVTGKAIFIEQMVVYSEEFEMGGTSDCLVVYPDSKAKRALHNHDLKTGFHRVEPNSEQNLFYSVCARKKIRDAGKDIDYVISSIYQPTHSEPYTQHIFTAKDLDRAEKKYLKAGQAIFIEKKPKFKVGDHCQKCKCRGVCTAFKKSLEKQNDLLLTINDAPALPTLPSAEMLTDEQLKNVILYGHLFVDMYEQAKKIGLQRHLTGKPIPDLKLVGSTPRRCLINDKQKIINHVQSLGVDPTVVEVKLKGITELEKELKQKAASKEEAKEKIEALQEVITRTTPKPFLVHVSDDRQAIESNSDLLADVTEDLLED
jgi:hypothetical protein